MTPAPPAHFSPESYQSEDYTLLGLRSDTSGEAKPNILILPPSQRFPNKSDMKQQLLQFSSGHWKIEFQIELLQKMKLICEEARRLSGEQRTHQSVQLSNL